MTDSITLGALIQSKQPERDQLAKDVEEFLKGGGKVIKLSVDATSGKTAQEIFAGCRELKRRNKR